MTTLTFNEHLENLRVNVLQRTNMFRISRSISSSSVEYKIIGGSAAAATSCIAEVYD